VTAVASTQTLLAGEHAAVYGFQVMAAQARGDLRARLIEAVDLHRAARDTLIVALTAQGATPVVSEAAYVLPSGSTPAETAALIETRLGVIYMSGVADPDSDVRATALDGLRSSTVRAAGWSGEAPTLPALNDPAAVSP
jgi:hypothetical protein